jgi:hypothetical protein
MVHRFPVDRVPKSTGATWTNDFHVPHPMRFDTSPVYSSNKALMGKGPLSSVAVPDNKPSWRSTVFA